MVNMLFYLKFRSQLRRTKPDIVRQIDEVLFRAVTDAGGKITGERSVFSAEFNEETPFFWLDLFVFIETLKKINDASKEFYGYALIIGSELPEQGEQLCRFLANNSGVFLDGKTAGKFSPYAEMENPLEWFKERKEHKYGSNKFYKVKEFKDFSKKIKRAVYFSDEVEKVLEQEKGHSVLILGPNHLLMKGGLYQHCKKLNGDFPVLSICFGSEGFGALADAWSAPIRSLSIGTTAEELNRIWELLFRERIRSEVSPFVVNKARRFLLLLLDYYVYAALKRNCTPVLALENIHLAGKTIIDLLLNILAGYDAGKNGLLILGMGEDNIAAEKLQQWEVFFNNAVKITAKEHDLFNMPKLPADIWEIIYAASLLGRFFSPELFQKLFEEEKKNPVMITRAFSILYMLGVIDNPREPWPLNRYFTECIGKIPEEAAARVKPLVCRRLLDWASKRNINPCFRLLSVLCELGGREHIDDILLLKTIFSDLINETTSGFELAMKNRQLEDIVTVQRTDEVRYIFTTFKALLSGNEKEIQNAYKIPLVENSSSPVLKTQMYINLCGYHLGMRDKDAAVETAKEAILLGQKGDAFCLPQAYRLFSLVCLSRQQPGESLEYIDFALANAEKTENYYEMGISAYYAATAQFLHGDIYKAFVLARKSIENSLAAGCPGWADRSRFLEGRLEFEIGHYCKAKDIFKAIQREPFARMTDEKNDLLSAWIYRSIVYDFDNSVNNSAAGMPNPASHDAGLFKIEAAYLSGNFEKAAELSGSLINSFSADNFLYTEKPDWRSGFAQCEHLYFSQGEVQNRMINVFNSLALCRLPGKYNEEALHKMQKILRDDRLSEMDPWNAFYFFAWYRILEQTGASSTDMSTAVSIAFKRLQRRASRIKDVETRRQYVNGPRWNHELCKAAKEFRLI